MTDGPALPTAKALAFLMGCSSAFQGSPGRRASGSSTAASDPPDDEADNTGSETVSIRVLGGLHSQHLGTAWISYPALTAGPYDSPSFVCIQSHGKG